MHEELEVRATFDTLTATYNRSAIMAALEGALTDTRQSDVGTAAIFIDLDHFKQVNDSLGHAAGDQLLAVVADRLRGAVRFGDTLGRLGGDEFLVVCPGIARPEVAMKVAERIAEEVVSVVELNGKTMRPQASIGVAWGMNGDIDSELLVARADLAMYESKRQGDGSPARWTAALDVVGTDTR
jgi:diguanylate cyclase (GGDEF)-like protein